MGQARHKLWKLPDVCFELKPPMAIDTSPILTDCHFGNSGVQVRLMFRKFQYGLACCRR
jgi:hypothetical protein